MPNLREKALMRLVIIQHVTSVLNHHCDRKDRCHGEYFNGTDRQQDQLYEILFTLFDTR